MAKKVYELANEMGMGAIDLVEKLKSMGFDVRNHMVALDDDTVDKAMAQLGPKTTKAAGTKKKVTKKKATKKKATKKKVVKKVAAAKEEEAPEVEVEETKEVAPKTTLIKKNAVVKKKARKLFDEDRPRGLQVVEAAPKPKVEEDKPPVSAEESPSPDKESKEVFKEKMHSFTPVYVPEKSEKEETPAKSESSASGYRSSAPDYEKSTKTDADNKKRMGSLAAIVSKKGGEERCRCHSCRRGNEACDQCYWAPGLHSCKA